MQNAISEQLIAVNGRTTHYYTAGDPARKTLLLLHGHLGDAWLHWSEVTPMLAEHYHVIAPDLPGYGQSDPLPKMDVDSLCAWAKALLDALEIPTAVVIGNSFGGGLTGRLMAAQYPETVLAVILVNGGVIPEVPGCANAIARVPLIGPAFYGRLAATTTSRTNLEGVFEDETHLTDDFVARVQKQRPGLSRLMRGMTTMTTPENKTPLVPVLLLWGEEDGITPRVVGEGIQQHIPGSKLNLIAETRHMPHVEAPEVFAFQVKRFLDEIAQPGEIEI